MPKSLRQRTIEIAHEGHQAVVQCKQRLGANVWWPRINKEIENYVKCCLPCQCTNPKKTEPEPIQSTLLPTKPWTHLAIDICGPFPSGDFIVVPLDYYSRWPEDSIMKTTTSEKIIKWLQMVFSHHGYHQKLTSDNGSQFVSEEFQNYLSKWSC